MVRMVFMGDMSDRVQEEAFVRIDGQVPRETIADDSIPPVTAIPQNALGPFGSIPVSCAIFYVDIDEEAHKAIDARYVYTSEEYCQMVRRSNSGLIGSSYLTIGEVNTEDWLAQCYRVIVDQVTISGFEYNPLVRGWVSYSLSPSAIEGYCVYALMAVAVDEQQQKRLVTSVGARTTLFIADMLSALSSEASYGAAMNGVLDMMSKVIRTDRLTIFESGARHTKVAFELCSEHAQPLIGTVFELPRTALTRWFKVAAKDPVVLVPDVAIIERFSAPLYEWCVQNDVKSLMAAPFFNDGEIVGFLGAYNYRIDETIDLNRLFATVSSFIGAHIENRRLIDSLEWAVDHDSLTNLLNRRGSQQIIGRLFAENSDGPFVLAILDLDDFKRINDVYGHNAGDEALRSLTQNLTQVFPEDAIISRNGGDEFLVMLSGEGASDADSLIAELAQRELSFEFEGEQHPMSISIGYASYPDQASGVKDLYSKADAALYAVKLAGKASFEKYAPEIASKHRSQLAFTARDIIDSVPYPLVVHDADNEDAILFASVELARVLGYDDLHDLMKKAEGAFSRIVHPDDRAGVLDRLAQQRSLSAADAQARFGFRALTKDGLSKRVEARFSLVDIPGVGEVFYTVLFPE